MLSISLFMAALVTDITKLIDKKANPCDDFFAYACGNFAKYNPLSEDQNSISQITLLVKRVATQLKTIVDEPIKPDDLKSIRLFKTQYQACMNVEEQEKLQLAPLKDLLDSFGGWPIAMGNAWNSSTCNWLTKEAQTFLSVGQNAFMAFEVDLSNSSTYYMIFDQPKLPIGHRDYLLDKKHANITKAYKNLIIRAATLLGANKHTVRDEAIDMLRLERLLAKISAPDEQRINQTTLNYQTTSANFLHMFRSKIPFKTYFEALANANMTFDNNQTVVIRDRNYFKRLSKQLEKFSSRTIVNYQLWNVAIQFFDHLAPSLRQNKMNFSSVRDGISKLQDQHLTCMESVSATFVDTVGYLYVNEYFKNDSKSSIDDIVSNLRKSMKNELSKSTWMDSQTAGVAIKKLDYMKAKIGYPEYIFNETRRLGDFASIELDPRRYFHNQVILKGTKRLEFQRYLNSQIHPEDWVVSAAVVNAFYYSLANEIIFPAAILQDPMFSKDFPSYVNYARAGSFIGHEITHGFDTTGSQFGPDGRLSSWWTPETQKKYTKAADCFVNQYSAIKDVQTGYYLNGNLTVGENIADNGGIRIAFDAYQNWKKSQKTEEPVPADLKNFTTDQLFFISYAQTWCDTSKTQMMQALITADEHPIQRYRVNVPLRNFPQFGKHFNCPLNSPMNPTKRCHLWS